MYRCQADFNVPSQTYFNVPSPKANFNDIVSSQQVKCTVAKRISMYHRKHSSMYRRQTEFNVLSPNRFRCTVAKRISMYRHHTDFDVPSPAVHSNVTVHWNRRYIETRDGTLESKVHCRDGRIYIEISRRYIENFGNNVVKMSINRN